MFCHVCACVLLCKLLLDYHTFIKPIILILLIEIFCKIKLYISSQINKLIKSMI